MANSSSAVVPFESLATADLVVDAIYEGGKKGNVSDDPVAKLLPVGNSGGFRYFGGSESPLVVALCSSGIDPDWPDRLDPESGRYTYFGDNRKPGTGMHDTPRRGNRLLTEVFGKAHGIAENRAKVSPFFIFENTGDGRNTRYLGCAVPGSSDLEPTEDLVAVWRSTQGLRFQNYRAVFTVLDISRVTREWIDDLIAGNPLSQRCPGSFRDWVVLGRYQPLRAPRTIIHRSPSQQLPSNDSDMELLRMVHQRFSDDPHEFEACAAILWRMLHGPSVNRLIVTRRSVDGGRDAIGNVSVGPKSDPIELEFALEAKCYEPGGGGVGVRDVARLISRLRHRQFGVFVTTNYVAVQAYKEVREDQHPVVILSGIDIVNILRSHGFSTKKSLSAWLEQDFNKQLVD